MFQAHFLFSLPQASLLQGALVPFNKGYVYSPGVSLLVGLSADKVREYIYVNQHIHTHVSISLYV